VHAGLEIKIRSPGEALRAIGVSGQAVGGPPARRRHLVARASATTGRVKLLFCASARRPVARGAAARADDDNVAGPGWFSTTRRRRQAQGIAKAKTAGLYGGRVEDTGRDAGIMEMLEAGQSWNAIQAATG
jgi:hypothetical protein